MKAITYFGFAFIFSQSLFADDISRFFSDKIYTRKFWISGTYSYSNNKIPSPIIQKKWMVSGTSLVEMTQNSVLNLPGGNKNWMSEKIEINDSIPFERVGSFPLPNPIFKTLSNESFAIISSQAIVIFRSSNSANKLLPAAVGTFNHMWAPVAFTFADMGLQSPFDPLPNIPHVNKTPLRHDLRKIRNVFLSANFPPAFLASVKKAVDEWNRGLRIKYYTFKGVAPNVTSEACLASDSLCIIWIGSPNLAWANFGAISTIFYDPAVGYIQGGVINIFNLQTTNPTLQVPKNLLDALNDIKNGPYVAGNIWAQPQYKEYINPDPQGTITALLIHEMGHDQGFRHYFGGSIATKPGSPSDTVMDYMPYPFFSKLQALGDRDIAKLDALYRNGNFGSQYSPEVPCADKEVATNPLCNPLDVGDPALYYSYLVNSLNPFHLIMPMGGVSAVFTQPKPVVEFAARFLVPSIYVTTYQRFIVEQTLCSNSEKDKIIAYLLSIKVPVKLNCDKFRRR